MSGLIELIQLHAQGRFPARLAEFTAVEVKTTGLRPGRVIELAAVRFRSDGQVLAEFGTVVNPGQGTSPGWEWAHGISREELDKAPAFGAILGPALDLCRGSVLVAHDLSLVGEFFSAELARAGVQLPMLPGVSTKDSVRAAIRLPNYRLGTVAHAFGIDGLVSRSALSSARVTARVAGLLIGAHGLAFVTPPRIPALPRYAAGGSPLARGLIPASSGGWMAEAVERVPIDPALAGAVDQAYLDLLAAAVGDRHISPDETWSLAALAAEAGLSDEAVRSIHTNFVSALRAVAESDGVVTDAEMRELSQVAKALQAEGILVGMRPAKDGNDAVRVLVLGASVQADEMRARVLDGNMRLAKKLTASVTHLVHDATIPPDEPRLKRATELGAEVLDLVAGSVVLGFAEAVETPPPAIAVMPSAASPSGKSRPAVMPSQPGPMLSPRSGRQAPLRGQSTGVLVLGRLMMALGLLVMFIVVVAMFGGSPLGAGILGASIGLAFLLGGWLVAEEGQDPRVRKPVANSS
ncbi:DNA polymerase III subunit epsilon [Amycolatopsis sp. WAC 01416]|uniref:exonuclease domain-containing protein n=1 Tax=Amycolatopsis sp. WAC 01416 TaxID=2203196 RepID=UPI000F7A384B|nr:exonuclease domain-containing protein [Amycolatopsis sp. WAC 01416]RSN38193.1 DNA polymerase III subunit epsilon [Amycolatopsis sp. WAC 01416]